MGRCVCLGTNLRTNCRQTAFYRQISLSVCVPPLWLWWPLVTKDSRASYPGYPMAASCSCRMRCLLGGGGNNCCPKDGKPQVCCSGQAKPCNELKKEMNIISANCVNFLCRTLFLENCVPVIYCLYERKFWTVLELFFWIESFLWRQLLNWQQPTTAA